MGEGRVENTDAKLVDLQWELRDVSWTLQSTQPVLDSCSHASLTPEQLCTMFRHNYSLLEHMYVEQMLSLVTRHFFVVLSLCLFPTTLSLPETFFCTVHAPKWQRDHHGYDSRTPFSGLSLTSIPLTARVSLYVAFIYTSCATLYAVTKSTIPPHLSFLLYRNRDSGIKGSNV
jgi:hypothetical protein